MAMSRQNGFTLIELMVAITIMGILLAVAVPSFESVVNTNKLVSAANELVASIQTARMESLRRNRRAIVCLSATPDAASPSCTATNPTGWITFLDADANGSFNGNDVLLRTSLLKQRVVVMASSNVATPAPTSAAAGELMFRSDGLARDGSGALLKGTISMCIPTRQPSKNVRLVNIYAGSRVSVSATSSNGACTTAPGNPGATT